MSTSTSTGTTARGEAGRVTVIAASGEVVLRPIVATDEPFLRRLYADSRTEELSVVPWSDEQRRAFCDSQFDLQDASYRREFPEARFEVVEQAGCPIGRLLVNHGPAECVILDILLVPEARGRGVGTLLLQWLQARAAEAGVAVVLTVEPGNPAQRLYEALGFRVRAEGELHREMAWRAEAVGPAAWGRFVQLVLDDPALRAALAGADDDTVLVERSVAAGLAHGLAFGADDVWSTLRNRRRAWFERGLA